MKIQMIAVPTTTYHYVRQSFGEQQHIAGNGRKPAAKTLCGIKRIGMWADCSMTPRNLCPTCKAQA